MKYRIFFLSALLLLQNLFGMPAPQKKIAVCTQGSKTLLFWKNVIEGIEVAAKETNAAPIYYGLYDFDTTNMPAYLEQILVSQPDGVILSIPDPASLEIPIRKMIAAGIPVIAIASGFNDFQKFGVQTFIGDNPYLTGAEVGKKLLDQGINKLLCIRNDTQDSALDERIRGVSTVFQEQGKTISLLTVRDFSPSTAAAVIATTLVVDREINGVLSMGGTTALPAIRSLEERELYGKIPFATFDVSSPIIQELQDDHMLFAVSLQPFMQGYLAMSILGSPPQTDVRSFFDKLNRLSKRNFFPKGTMPYQSYESPSSVLYTGPLFITAETPADQVTIPKK